MLLTIAVFASGNTVSAQTIHHVSPRAIEETVQPGDIVSAEITVRNTYPYRITVYPSVHGLLEVRDGTSTQEQILPSGETVVAKWLTMTQAGQRLLPEEEVIVSVRLAIPRDVESGVYRALLGFGQGIDRPTAQQAVERGVAPGVVLRLTVPEKDIQTDGAVSLDITNLVLADTQPAIAYRISNPGTKTVVPQGEIIITNKRGAEVAAVPINPGGAPLAPGEVLSVATATPALPWLGAYAAAVRVDYQNQQLAAVSMSDSFWYLPWPVLLAFVVALVILSVLFYVYLARRLRSPIAHTDGAAALPLHVYEGQSPAEDHDINLKT
ncbi:hypothetical protein CL655_03420 [bacterium]|nr:hypothetical protein [bacterium]|tara:strand:+ start:1985 stop:2956 length:972 start_codon:yes stop_codon:yes gene_type:complete